MRSHDAGQNGRGVYIELKQPDAGEIAENPWQGKCDDTERDTPDPVAFHLLQVYVQAGKEHDEQQSHPAEKAYLRGDMQDI